MNSVPFPDRPLDEEGLLSDAAAWPTGPDPEIERVQPLVEKLCEQARGVESTVNPRESAGTGPDTVPPEVESGATEPLPERIGRYEIVARLGEGGMGVVFRARDPALDREVALKLPRLAGFGEAEHRARERFLREARAAAGVRHPHLCPIYDVGEHEGRPFVVMEFVDGQSLHERLKQGRFDDARAAVSLIAQVARALQVVHGHGLIHRDLKPANILLDRQGRPYVTDFGLARPLEGSERLTSEGVTPGTPRYMSPEQIDPALGELGPATDIYSLGVVLYEMLAGRTPFTGSLSALFAQITCAEPPALSEFRPDLDAVLVRCIHKALSRRPDDRFASAGKFAEALEGWLSGRDVMLSPPAALSPRRRRAAVFAAVAALAGVCALALYLLNREQSPLPVSPSAAAAKPAPEKLRVLSLDVKHYAKEGEKDEFLGLLGTKTFYDTHLHDSVDIEAKLSRPAYAYLIAFRTDGKDELCFPEKQDQAPPRSDGPCYPSAKSDMNFGLDEGEGFQVFAVVAANDPLPPYQTWRSQRGQIPWQKFPAAAGVVWRDDGEKVFPVVEDEAGTQRGKGRKLTGRTPLVRLTEWLRKDPKVTTVAAIGFAVLPKKAP